jgi:hypothetical protein
MAKFNDFVVSVQARLVALVYLWLSTRTDSTVESATLPVSYSRAQLTLDTLEKDDDE